MLISVFLVCLGFAQTSDKYTISGEVKLLSGLEISTPIQAYIKIESAKKYTITDSKGLFKIDGLDKGKYILSVHGFGYNSLDTLITLTDSNKNINLLLFAKCEINQEIAQRDIKNKTPKLLIVGGIAPTVYPDQHIFEEKFGVKYDDYGDVPPPEECLEEYNMVIFDYLDKNYGKSWRKEVRKDVVGLKN